MGVRDQAAKSFLSQQEILEVKMPISTLLVRASIARRCNTHLKSGGGFTRDDVAFRVRVPVGVP